MSKYVDHKHGMCIGSDNIFFVIDKHHEGEPELVLPDGVEDFRDGYRSIFFVKDYRFSQINSLNVFIRTPAQQLIWKDQSIDIDKSFNHDDEEINYKESFRYCILTNYVENWLNKNVGEKYKMWDVRSRAQKCGTDCIFFKRRKDAYALMKEISRHLEGIRYA